MRETVREEIARHIRRLRLFNTHDHHGYDSWHRNLTLVRVLRSSHACWSRIHPDVMYRERRTFLEKIQHNTEYLWTHRALQDLYELDEPISAANWDDVSDRITAAHEDPERHLTVLRERCRFDGVVLDSFQLPGSDQGHPDLFKPTYRIDMFLAGYHPELADHDGHNPLLLYQRSPRSFDDYLDFTSERVRLARRSGCIALKLASAYDRALRFGPPRHKEAERTYRKHPAQLEPGELAVFGDFMLHHLLNLAMELDLPVQVHMGMVALEGASPMEFTGILQQYPRLRFDLFHGGYPWTDAMAGLAHLFRNIWLDLCWLPQVSTFAAEETLNIWLDVTDSCEKILWGSDTMTAEEAFGTVLAVEHFLSRALTRRVEMDLTDVEGACELAEKILHHNPRKLLNI